MRRHPWTLALLALTGLPALAADGPVTTERRWAGAVQVEFSAGGDDLYDEDLQLTKSALGDGVSLALGLFYRPIPESAFELQTFLGFKTDHVAPVTVGPDVSVRRTVVQFLGNYRNARKWYASGGLVLHTNTKFEDNWPGAVDLDFDDAVGVTVEGGWNWVGLQCTYMEYRSPGYGDFDASNCGVRLTFRFPRWRPPRAPLTAPSAAAP
jgi:hypothetical protein